MHCLIFQSMLHLTSSLAIKPPATSSSYLIKSLKFFDLILSSIFIRTSSLTSELKSNKMSAPSSESIIFKTSAISLEEYIFRKFSLVSSSSSEIIFEEVSNPILSKTYFDSNELNSYNSSATST